LINYSTPEYKYQEINRMAGKFHAIRFGV